MSLLFILKQLKKLYFINAKIIIMIPFFYLLSRWAEINAPQTRSGEKLSFPPHAFAGVNSGGNPQPIGGERKVQLIMFTYFSIFLLIIKSYNFLVYWQGCISLL
ncbi:hypothetical protein AM228_20840 [Planktothricoides sp. SR001]|nr:hypothetical protein AM228_20840 [Planktothricoides sp. SR001]